MSLFPKISPRLFTAAAVATTLVMGASAAMAGPYSARWTSGTTTFEREINPIVSPNGTGFRTAAQYYSYSSPFGASANTPDNLERSNTLTMFLYDDPNNGLSLFHIYDEPNDGSGMRANLSITSAGLQNTGQGFIVRDDPGDSSFAWNDATGDANISFFSSSCCTDGWVLGLLPDASTESWWINTQYSDLQGIDQFDIVTLRDPFGTGPRIIDRFSIARSSLNTLQFIRNDETVVAMSEPAAALFPLAALFLIGGITRNRRRARTN